MDNGKFHYKLSSNDWVLRADSSHVNCPAFCRLRSHNVNLSERSSMIFCMAFFISVTLNGLTSSAASPTTSGKEAVFEAMTGEPHAIASSAVSPKPSYTDGIIVAHAPEYSAGKSAS